MVTLPIERLAGTGICWAGWRTRVSAPPEAGLSQNFFTVLFYPARQNKALAAARAWFHGLSVQAFIRAQPRLLKLLLRRFGRLGVLAAEAFYAPGGIHQLLLSGEKWMAVRTDFHRDVALVGRPRHKRIAAGAVHAHFTVCGMNGCFHSGPNLVSNH